MIFYLYLFILGNCNSSYCLLYTRNRFLILFKKIIDVLLSTVPCLSLTLLCRYPLSVSLVYSLFLVCALSGLFFFLEIRSLWNRGKRQKIPGTETAAPSLTSCVYGRKVAIVQYIQGPGGPIPPPSLLPERGSTILL